MTDVKTKITPEQKATISSVYASGVKTQTELAQEYGVSLTTINKLLKGSPKPEKRKYHSKNTDKHAEIVRLYKDENLTLRALSERFGCSHQYISQVLHHHGCNPGETLIQRNAAKMAAHNAEKLARREAKELARNERIEKLSSLWKAGATVEEIRVAGGLKSINATNVLLVNSRKRYGVDKFPLRRGQTETPAQ